MSMHSGGAGSYIHMCANNAQVIICKDGHPEHEHCACGRKPSEQANQLTGTNQLVDFGTRL